MHGRRLLISAALGLASVLAIAAMVVAATRTPEPIVVVIKVHYSHFEPSHVTVPAGHPVTFILENTDPIDHEWIVGDEALQQRHRTGNEPYHSARPTEVTIDAGTTKTTVVTFTTPGNLTYVCHLPGHEAYGMTGYLVVTTD